MIVIVGILATFATLSIGNRAMDDRMQDEGQRFVQLFKLAEEESQIKGMPIGLRFTDKGYTFLVMNDKRLWVDYGQGVLRYRPVAQPFYTELHVEGRLVPPAVDEDKPGIDPEEARRKVQPQIMILPGGETTSFALDLKVLNYRAYFHVEADALGRMQYERRTLQ